MGVSILRDMLSLYLMGNSLLTFYKSSVLELFRHFLKLVLKYEVIFHASVIIYIYIW